MFVNIAMTCSDLEEASGAMGHAKPAPAVTVPRPKGGMVAELSRSIELQLQVCVHWSMSRKTMLPLVLFLFIQLYTFAIIA